MFIPSLRGPKGRSNLFLRKTIALVIVCSFLASDISWAFPSSFNQSENTTIAVESRFRPFFEKHGLDFKNMAGVIYAAVSLRDLLKNQGTLNGDKLINIEREINKLNTRLFPDRSVEIDAKVDTRKIGDKNYRSVVFNFSKDGKTIPIDALFFDDHSKLTDDELRELRVVKEDDQGNIIDDRHHLDCPGLEGVWFVKRTESPVELTPAPGEAPAGQKVKDETTRFISAGPADSNNLIKMGIKDNNGHFEITIKGGDAFAVICQDAIYIDFEKTALYLEKDYPGKVKRLRAAFSRQYSKVGKKLTDEQMKRKMAEFVHCHEIFHLMIERIAPDWRVGLKMREEDLLANIFAVKALGVELNFRERQLLTGFAEKIERKKKEVDSLGFKSNVDAFLTQLELPYFTTEPSKEGKVDFFYNLKRNLGIDLSNIYRATIMGINDAVWTFKTGKTIDVGPENRVRVVVGEPRKGAPGFVWAGIKDDSGNWSNTRKIPLTENSKGQHEAVLPEDVNAFTFFWTGGEDVKSGRSQGHWEGQDFYINRYAAGTPLVQQSVTKDLSDEQSIAKVSLEIARAIHDNGFEAVLLMGDSALLPKVLLTAAWKRLYGDKAMPLIYLIDHDSRMKLLEGEEDTSILEEVFKKAIGDNDGALLKELKSKKLIVVDDYLLTGGKRMSVDNMLKALGFRQPAYYCLFTAHRNPTIFRERFPYDVITNFSKFTFVGSYDDDMLRVMPALSRCYFHVMNDGPAIEPYIREYTKKYVEKIIAEINSTDSKDRLSDTIDVINPANIPQDKPVMAIFDVHGTLLQPNWKEAFERGYFELMGERPSAEWIKEHIWRKSDKEIISALSEKSGKAESIVTEMLERIRETIWDTEVPPRVPGALELVKALKARGVPIFIVSRSYTKNILKQLKSAGFLDYIPAENIVGRRGEKDDDYSRAEMIKAVAAHYPNHTVAYFDDWTEAAGKIGDSAVYFGVAQGDGEEFDYNYGQLKEAHPDYILKRQYEWQALDKLLTVPPEVQAKDEKIPVAEDLAREMPTVLPAPRHDHIRLHIDVSDDLKWITYSLADDEGVFKEDGTVDYGALKLTELIKVPSSYLITPKRYLDEHLTGETKDTLLGLLSEGKRYTRYKGVTTSWDMAVDKDVWTTNIDTVFMHKRMEELGILKRPDIRSVIEIGVGGGHLSAALAASLPNLEQISITDISLYALRTARRCIEPFLKPGARLRYYLGKDIKTVKGTADLVIVNPPYIPTPPDSKYRKDDPYRGTGLIREILKDGVSKLNKDNPDAQILINISSMAKKDWDRYCEEFKDYFTITPVGPPLKVPLKIWTIASSPEWTNWLIREGGLEFNKDAKPDEEPYWHTLQAYSIKPKTQTPEMAQWQAREIQRLIRDLRAPIPRLRFEAANELGKIGPPAIEAVWELANLVRSKQGEDNDSPSVAARDALVKLGPDVIPHLIWHLKDPANPDRKPFALALSEFGEAARDAVPVLVSIMGMYQKENEWYRHSIVSTLIKIGKNRPETVPALVKAMKTDPNDDVQATAIWGLRRILDMDAVEMFVAFIKEFSDPYDHRVGVLRACLSDFGLDCIPLLLKIEETKPEYSPVVMQVIGNIAATNAGTLIKHVHGNVFGSVPHYDIALERLFGWSGTELKERWADLRILTKDMDEHRAIEYMCEEPRRLKNIFGEREQVIWKGYVAITSKVWKNSRSYFSGVICRLSIFINSSAELTSMGDDLIRMDESVQGDCGFVLNGGVPVLLKHIMDTLSMSGKAFHIATVENFRREWSRCVDIIAATKGYYWNLFKNTVIFKLVLKQDPEQYKKVIASVDIIWERWKELNDKADVNQKCDERHFREQCLPVICSLELILPGSIRFISEMLKDSFHPGMIVRYVDSKSHLFGNERLVTSFTALLGRIQERLKRRKYKPDPSAFAKVLDSMDVAQLAGYGDGAASILDDFNQEEVNRSDIGQIPSILADRMRLAMARQCFWFLDLSTEKIKGVPYESLINTFYPPFVSRLSGAFEFIKNKKPEKLGRFTGLILAALQNKFWDFIENKGQDDYTGRGIAWHNEAIRKNIESVGVNCRKWLGKDAQDRMKPRDFIYQKGARDDKHNGTGDAMAVIDYIQRSLAADIDSSRRDELKKLLNDFGIDIGGDEASPVLMHNKYAESKYPSIIKSIVALNKPLAEYIDKTLVGDSGAELSISARETLTHLRERIDVMTRRIDEESYLGSLSEETMLFMVRPILRQPGHDIFIGDFASCCLAMDSKTFSDAMVDRLIDEGMNVLEVVDRNTGLTMAAAWLFLSQDGNLVIQNLEIHSDYMVDRILMDAIGMEMIRYSAEFAEYIGSKRLYIGMPGHGKYFSRDGLIETRYKDRVVSFGQEKIGGYLGAKYYLDSAGKPEAYLAWEAPPFPQPTKLEPAPDKGAAGGGMEGGHGFMPFGGNAMAGNMAMKYLKPFLGPFLPAVFGLRMASNDEPASGSAAAAKAGAVAALCRALKAGIETMNAHQVYGMLEDSGVTATIAVSNKDRQTISKAFSKTKDVSFDKTYVFPFKTPVAIVYYLLSNMHWTSLDRLAKLSEDDFVRYINKMLEASSIYSQLDAISRSSLPFDVVEIVHPGDEKTLDQRLAELHAAVEEKARTSGEAAAAKTDLQRQINDICNMTTHWKESDETRRSIIVDSVVDFAKRQLDAGLEPQKIDFVFRTFDRKFKSEDIEKVSDIAFWFGWLVCSGHSGTIFDFVCAVRQNPGQIALQKKYLQLYPSVRQLFMAGALELESGSIDMRHVTPLAIATLEDINIMMTAISSASGAAKTAAKRGQTLQRGKRQSGSDPFLRQAPSDEFGSAEAETGRIHKENCRPENRPTIPEKTILCHIITDSILPYEQREKWLNPLEEGMRGVDYNEKVAYLKMDNSKDFTRQVRETMDRVKKDYEEVYGKEEFKNYIVEFDVACPDTELVGRIRDTLGLNALAFEPCDTISFDAAQVEGIMLALRALRSNEIEKLRTAYKILTGREPATDTNDINQFIRMITFKLPAAKMRNTAEIRELNELISKNIRTAA